MYVIVYALLIVTFYVIDVSVFANHFGVKSTIQLKKIYYNYNSSQLIKCIVLDHENNVGCSRRTGTQLCDLLNSIDNIKLDDRPDDKSVNNIQLQLSQIKTNLTRLALPGMLI